MLYMSLLLLNLTLNANLKNNMALIDKETIRAEIDKRYAEYRAKMKTDDFTYYEGMADALDLFEQFLDSIQGQPVEGLEEAAQHDAINTYAMPKDGDIEKVMKVQEARILHEIGFKAGAELGAEHAKK